jgi:hypothetical protein
MKLALISANLGGYEQCSAWRSDLMVPHGVRVDVHRFTDSNFPPRTKAMTSRLQAGIPKWYGWQMVPDYDAYIWIDASCAPNLNAVEWFLDHLGDRQIAVFQHPERRSIQAEYEFMIKRMARPGETYLNARYAGEDLRGQFESIAADRRYVDDKLYASTAFIYRPTASIRDAFADVWTNKARFLLHDQLIFPYALWKHSCQVNVIPDNYLQCEGLTFVRRGERRSA